MSFSVAPGLLVAFMLALVRTSCWIALAPPFSSSFIPAKVKAGLSIAIAISVSPHLYGATGPATALPPSNWAFISSLLLQAFTGLALGFLTSILFSAVRAAGAFIDIFGGFSISAAYDPLLKAQSTVMSRVYDIVAMMLLFATGGDLMIMKGFLTSFNAAPLTGVKLHSLTQVLTVEVSTFFLSAFEIAGPLIAVLFLADVILGLLTKAAPQMNAFSLGFPLKILITLLVVGMALPLLPGAVTTLVTEGVTDGLHLVGLG